MALSHLSGSEAEADRAIGGGPPEVLQYGWTVFLSNIVAQIYGWERKAFRLAGLVSVWLWPCGRRGLVAVGVSSLVLSDHTVVCFK